MCKTKFKQGHVCAKFKTLDPNVKWLAFDTKGIHAGRLSNCAPPWVMIGCLACTRDMGKFREGLDVGVPPSTFLHPEYPANEDEVDRRCRGATMLAYFRGQGIAAVRQQVAKAVQNVKGVVVDLTTGYHNVQVNAWLELS